MDSVLQTPRPKQPKQSHRKHRPSHLPLVWRTLLWAAPISLQPALRTDSQLQSHRLILAVSPPGLSPTPGSRGPQLPDNASPSCSARRAHPAFGEWQCFRDLSTSQRAPPPQNEMQSRLTFSPGPKPDSELAMGIKVTQSVSLKAAMPSD